MKTEYIRKMQWGRDVLFGFVLILTRDVSPRVEEAGVA